MEEMSSQGVSPLGFSSLGSGGVRGSSDHLCRCVWFSHGNPPPRLQNTLAVLRDPLINCLGIDSFLEMPHSLSGKIEPGGKEVNLLI